MKKEDLYQEYKGVYTTPIRSLDYDYLSGINTESPHLSTETGEPSDSITPSLNLSDGIFSELPPDVLHNERVQPFLIVLYYTYLSQKNLDYTYLPLTVGDKDEDSIVLDWIYETVRFSFFFMKDKDVYSITRYDSQKNSFSQKIEDMPSKRYKEIASQVIQAIA